MSKLYDLLQSIISKVKANEKSLKSVPKTVNDISPDSNGNIEIDIPENGGVSSWNDLTDKPFYEEYSTTSDTLTWDGNTEGRECVLDALYHVSDDVPTLEDFRNGYAISRFKEGEVLEPEYYSYETLLEGYEMFGIVMSMSQEFIIVPHDNAEFAGLTFPKAGVYFMGELSDDGVTCSRYYNRLTINGYGKFSGTVLKTLDEKFLPDTLASKEFVKKSLESSDGDEVTASGYYAKAEGHGTIASGDFSHAEGAFTHAEGYGSHAEGHDTHTESTHSHAEGSHTTTKGLYSHAEGFHAETRGDYSHAEGNYTIANGKYSHAEGVSTESNGHGSHAEGKHTIASAYAQHVEGAYNIEDVPDSPDDPGKYIKIVGNGTAHARSNAHTIDWFGNGWFKNNLYIGGESQDDENAIRVLTENDIQYIVQMVLNELNQ